MNFPFQGGRLPIEARPSAPKQLRMSPLQWVVSSRKQVLLTMQASAIFLFAVCLQASATGLSQTVSFTGNDVPLKTVFTSLKKQTGYGVFYQNGESATLEGTNPVTLDLKNVSLDLFLQLTLRNQPLEYSVEGTTIFLKRKEDHPSVTVEVAPGEPINEIKGRVTNTKGEALANANITVKRTRRGTITDANGNFTLHNVNSDDVITISFIGYKPQSLPLRDRANLVVFMQPATDNLDKVVVQAYGTTSERLATGNIGVVSAEQIAKQPVMNALNVLQGQVPGAVVTDVSGYASGTVKVEIRGRNTINPNFPSDPLYIIDGVPLTILDVSNTASYGGGSPGFIQSGIGSPAYGQSPFFSINPADIESITVLKDADATAIYGSRASNGVILITTKKGKTDKTKFDLSFYQGIDKITHFVPLLNTPQYVAMRKEALQNDGLPVDIYNAPDLLVGDSTRYTDWQKQFWGGTGKISDVEGALMGGNTQTSFRLSGGYRYQKDLTATSGGNQRISTSFNLNHKSLDRRFSASLTSTYSYAYSDMIAISGYPTMPPNAPAPYDKYGNLNYSEWDAFLGSTQSNPFSNLLQPYKAKTNYLNSSLLLTFELLKGLTLKGNLGYNNVQVDQTMIMPIASMDPAIHPKGSNLFGYTRVHNIIAEPQLEYNSFINKGKLSLLSGFTYQANYTDGTNLRGIGYANDALLGSINAAPTKYVYYFQGQYKYTGVFARVNYNWANKYILNLNARRDGSSKFGPGRQFGNFGSAGMAWNFSEEKWIKEHLHFLSFGKLRASYGLLGGDQIGDYAYLTQWAFSPTMYNGYVPTYPIKHTDSLLHWEVNKKLEFAIDLAFLDDKLGLQASWYRNRCNDQLVPFPTPVFTGFDGVEANSPADVENTGFEFVFRAKTIDSKSFQWENRLSIGFNRNKLLSYPNISQSPYSSELEVGKSLNIRKLLHCTGVDPQTGLYTFTDKNKDGVITAYPTSPELDDRFDYDLSTKYEGSFNTEFSYKGWQLGLLFYFRKQMGVNAYVAMDPPGDMTNQPVEVFNNHWKQPGDHATFAKFTTSPADVSYNNFQYNSDGILTDASFIRLQNLDLSYILDPNKLKKAGIESLKLYIQCRNLFVLTHYKGTDPEVRSFQTLPKPKTITAGISLTF